MCIVNNVEQYAIYTSVEIKQNKSEVASLTKNVLLRN